MFNVKNILHKSKYIEHTFPLSTIAQKLVDFCVEKESFAIQQK